MEPIIKIENISKEFKVLNRREGVKGSIMDLFSRDYNIINAVNDITMNVLPGECVGYLGPNGAGNLRQLKRLNQDNGTTVILTTHDMGDVDSLCNRIVIIDKGTMIYDNTIDNLRNFFGTYRTLKIRFVKNEDALTADQLEQDRAEVEALLKNKMKGATSLTITTEEKWVDILVNEEEVSIMKIMQCIQDKKQIFDMSIQEISTESVIKKIYEGGVA